jgi:uncharacterized Fe-S radical SAM superfamily protein PflX
MRDDKPSYLALHASGELERRAQRARSLLGDTRCRVCPRLCKVDRLSDRTSPTSARRLAEELGLRRLDKRSRAVVSRLAAA